jgi:hypothetical protein
MIGYTLPEIRRLLISLVHACAPDPGSVWSWSCCRSHAVRVSDRRIWVFCALGAGSCARCVYEERDPILEVLLTCRVYYRDFQPVAADTEIGR